MSVVTDVTNASPALGELLILRIGETAARWSGPHPADSPRKR
jgi:hypothetical protein